MNLRKFLSWLLKLPVVGLAVGSLAGQKVFLQKVHLNEMIGLRWIWPTGEEWEVTGHVKEGEEYLGQKVTNAWRNKFWMHNQQNDQTIMVCFAARIKDGCVDTSRDKFYRKPYDDAWQRAINRARTNTA